MKLTTAHKAFAAIIIANLIWGAAAVVFKISLTNIPPFTLAFLRFSIGALLLFLFLRKDAKLPTTNYKDLYLLIGYAFSGITMNIIFFFLGLRLTLSINSPIIAASQPALIYLLALLFLHERFHIRKLTGMVLGTVGIILIVIEPLLEADGSGNILGNVFLVIATISAVFQTIIGKKILYRVNPLAFTLWAFVIGSASFLPLAIYEFGTIPNLYQSIDLKGIIGIVYGAVFSSSIAYGLYAWGLSKIDASDASMFTYVDPILGTILGWAILKEPVTSYFIIGSVCIFGGIFLAEGRLHYHRFIRFEPIEKLRESVHEIDATMDKKTKKISRSTHDILVSIFSDNSRL